MKVIMYGTEICPECVEAKEQLKNYSDIEVDYKDITKTTTLLKEFLSHRDQDAVFMEVIKEGRIGIPFFILEDGTKTFDLSDFIH